MQIDSLFRSTTTSDDRVEIIIENIIAAPL
jgi:hypothetical protein